MCESLRLYEALLWEPARGYFLLELHLERLRRSASHFEFELNADLIHARLEELASSELLEPRKVRLELERDGTGHIFHEPVRPSTPVRVRLAAAPVQSSNEWLRHKTSRRETYDTALAARSDAQDVILFNERGELTETCHANLVLEIEGERLTPALDAGLLPGTFREHLLERERIREASLPVDALRRADALFLINSVRRWCTLELLRD